MHTGNLAFIIPSLHTLTEEELLEKLGNPYTGPITRKDGKPLEANKPEYLVSNIKPFAIEVLSAQVQIKIIDFGESFPHDDIPDKLNTPLCLGAPEALFDDRLDYRVDLWAAGCLVSIPTDYTDPDQS
jgi:serine/threonine-protein kinase SRPK3